MKSHTKKHLGFYGILEQKNTILVVKKSRGPYTNLYDLPGGRTEGDETILKTLEREIKEETGIGILNSAYMFKITKQLSYENSQNEIIDFHHLAYIYSITDFDFSTFQPDICNEDVAGSCWIEKNLLNSTNSSPILLEVLKKIR
jgi:8-oxo-dGTP pyrophosphatase MutT (NUDIX family)